jgi:uncharacterized membrane protein YGL010W
MGKFNLKDQLGFYASYHAHPLNVLIHVICVPLILWTAVVWATYTGPLVSVPTAVSAAIPAPFADNFELNLGTIGT